MFRLSLFIISVFCLFLTACSTQEATEADYLDGAEGFVDGPGLFSGDKGAFTLEDVFGDDKKKLQKNGISATSSDVNIPAIDQQSFEDFENFKAWRRAQDPDSPNYQEYQDWRAYQQYLRFKAEQEQASPAATQ